MVNLKRTASPGKSTVEVRASGAVRLLGMRPDVPANALGPNEFVVLQNVRRIGPGIVARPGRQQFYNFQDGRQITGMGDLPLGTLRPLVVIGDGCHGISPTEGQSIATYTVEQSPNFSRQVYKPTATRIRPVRFKRGASIDGLIPPVDGRFFSIDNQLYQFQTVPVEYGTEAISTSGGSQEVLVWTAPAQYSAITAMIQHGNALLIAVQGVAADGIGTSAIIRWDGLTFSVDDDGLNPVGGFALLRDMAVAGFDGTPNEIRVRSSAGEWTSVIPDAGIVGLLGDNRAASYQDRLYLPFGEDIFRFDGTNLTRIPVATTGVDAGATIYGLARAFGYLFGTWSTPTPSNMLLRFDGTTWEPSHKDFIAQVDTVRDARSVRLYQGCLVVAAVTTSGAALFRSQRRETTWTWESLIPLSAAQGDISELMDF